MRLGRRKPHAVWTCGMAARAAELRAAGLSHEAIAREIGSSASTVRVKLIAGDPGVPAESLRPSRRPKRDHPGANEVKPGQTGSGACVSTIVLPNRLSGWSTAGEGHVRVSVARLACLEEA